MRKIKRRRSKSKDGDYNVGYGKPPQQNQFSKGQSGNWAGRSGNWSSNWNGNNWGNNWNGNKGNWWYGNNGNWWYGNGGHYPGGWYGYRPYYGYGRYGYGYWPGFALSIALGGFGGYCHTRVFGNNPFQTFANDSVIIDYTYSNHFVWE